MNAPRFLLLAGLCFAGTALAATGLAGRRVTDVLADQAGSNIRFIYNDQIVPPAFRVQADPDADDPVGIATEILAPYGLGLQSVGDRVFAVIAVSAIPAAGEKSGNTGATAADIEIPDLVVTTSRYSLVYDESGSANFITEAEVHNLPKAADETLRVLHRLPGVASSGVAAPPYIRGGEQGEILYLMDGLQLYEPFHGKDLQNIVSIFDSRFVQGIDFHSGGYGAEYGDRMSGVVNVIPLDAPFANQFELGLNLFHTSALGAGSFADGRGSWLASVRRSNLDEVADIFNSDFGEAHYYDLLLSGSYQLTSDTRVALNFMRSDDSIGVNDSDKTEIVDANYLNNYVWGVLEHDWSDSFSGRFQLAATDIDNSRDGTIDDPAGQSGSLYDRKSFSFVSLKADFQLLSGQWLTRWGAEARDMEADYRYVSSVSFAPDFAYPGSPAASRQLDLAPSPDGLQLAAYLTGRYRFNDQWSAELGLRWDDQDYDSLEHSDKWSPRLGLRYAPGARTVFRLAAGRYYQTQGINELQVEDGVDQFFPMQYADHFVFGVDQELTADTHLRVELYYKDFGELRPRFENQFDSLNLLPELQPDRVRVAPDSAVARGLELSLSGTPTGGPWSWWFNYAWSRITDRLAGADVVRSWDQRHALNMGLNWSTQDWDVTLTGNYHTGWPTTAVSYAAGQTTFGPRNGERFDDFRSVDVKVARLWPLARGELELFVEVTNVFMFDNPCCVTYSTQTNPDGSLRLGEDPDNWPKVVPNAGVYWRF